MSLNTAAVARPEVIGEVATEFGAQCVVVAIDARRRTGDGETGWGVTTHGGRTPTSLDAVAWAVEAVERGAGEILLTSMDRDGTRDGFDLELTAVADAVSVPVIASGGVGTLDHLADGVLEGHADAVLAASIFHFGEHTVGEAKAAMATAASSCVFELGRLVPRLLAPASRIRLSSVRPAHYGRGVGACASGRVPESWPTRRRSGAARSCRSR